jgi:hypothetical protein
MGATLPPISSPTGKCYVVDIGGAGATAMATLAGATTVDLGRVDVLSGTPRAGLIDRWIYVFTAAIFIVVTLTGFIPDSMHMLADVRSGARPPLPWVLHLHAVLMGSFLLLLLTQTVLMATGRPARHRQLGMVAFGVAAMLVVVGLILATTMYHLAWHAAQGAPPETRAALDKVVLRKGNILLLQSSIGLLFSLFLIIGARARARDAGLHKRMMILAPAVTMLAGIDRIGWLPTSLPSSPIASEFYVLATVAPMVVWDVVRNRSVHRAYWIWLSFAVPVAIAVNLLWDSPGWQRLVPVIMGV